VAGQPPQQGRRLPAAGARHRHRRGGRRRGQPRGPRRGGGRGAGGPSHGGGAGALHVGPRSAGAVPGPVCYDQGGTEVTLTDANVTLGYLHPERLPSGLRLDAGKARRALAEQVAARLGIDVADAAYGVYLLGCAGMARAVRAVTIERGRDPREITLVAFGGKAPLFSAEMAR